MPQDSDCANRLIPFECESNLRDLGAKYEILREAIVLHFEHLPHLVLNTNSAFSETLYKGK
ncbi:MAG: hypothetical protein MHMPM18_004593 [Marteilia pararefringens]